MFTKKRKIWKTSKLLEKIQKMGKALKSWNIFKKCRKNFQKEEEEEKDDDNDDDGDDDDEGADDDDASSFFLSMYTNSSSTEVS